MGINRISLYHLETLLAIDRLGTFAAAAERLSTTQPAISARIRELEGHLRAKLFRREGRTMTLTPAGRQLIRDCGDLWGDLQGALMRSGGLDEASGVIRIGTGEIAAASCLPSFLSELKAAMPLVSLEVDIDLTANLIQKLLAGRTDIAFAAGPVAHPVLQSRSIGEVALMWLASPEIAARFAEPTRSRAISIWSLARHSPIYGRMRDAIAESKIPQQSLNLCNNARMMIDIAKVGGGVGIFPESMVRSELASGALIKVPDMPPIAPVQFQVVKRLFDNDALTDEIFNRASVIQVGG
ncbi:LysR family transcriptional regulator [Sphingobium sp. EP60837]|uniref:LysR family transcriptional regulator n=1 Tax=Sphingobium sp. EP60837 TaxID=1855519 RepID=UPI0007DD58D8|nr:LysR family transcriptional regulator [Sphingobium sp. EP60837]ANI80113.1 Hca operon transcriptional activator HcaR [Sphingobium sp. EP60837]